MCPICGTALNLSASPQADRERAFIRREIAEGKTKDQIKDELVAQYGTQVLAEPPKSGFDLTAWLVPGVAILIAGPRGASRSSSTASPRPTTSDPSSVPRPRIASSTSGSPARPSLPSTRRRRRPATGPEGSERRQPEGGRPGPRRSSADPRPRHRPGERDRYRPAMPETPDALDPAFEAAMREAFLVGVAEPDLGLQVVDVGHTGTAAMAIPMGQGPRQHRSAPPAGRSPCSSTWCARRQPRPPAPTTP